MANLEKYKKKKKNYLLPIIAGLVLIGAILFVLEKKGITNLIKTKPKQVSSTGQPQETINYTPTSPDEQKQIDDNKTNPQKTPANQQPVAAEVSILSAVQNGNNVVVQTKLTGDGWKSCTLSLTQGANTITKTAEAFYQREFSSCAGFTVTTSELTNGVWIINLTALKTDGSIVKSPTVQVNVSK